MRLLLIIIFLMGFNQLYAQVIDIKYLKVYHFIDSIQKQEFNVCPIIKYIGLSPFGKQLSNCETIPEELKDSKQFYKKYYFEPYINSHFDSTFKNKKNYDHYLLFSKPVENILLVELRKGHYNLKSPNKPYFGTTDKYLFIFNDQSEIVKSFKDTIIYN